MLLLPSNNTWQSSTWLGFWVCPRAAAHPIATTPLEPSWARRTRWPRPAAPQISVTERVLSSCPWLGLSAPHYWPPSGAGTCCRRNTSLSVQCYVHNNSLNRNQSRYNLECTDAIISHDFNCFLWTFTYSVKHISIFNTFADVIFNKNLQLDALLNEVMIYSRCYFSYAFVSINCYQM